MAGIISYPFDTIRRRMMIQSGEDIKSYRTSFECYRHIRVKEGYMGFFKGCLTNCLRGGVGSLSLILYDNLQQTVGLDLTP